MCSHGNMVCCKVTGCAGCYHGNGVCWVLSWLWVCRHGIVALYVVIVTGVLAWHKALSVVMVNVTMCVVMVMSWPGSWP